MAESLADVMEQELAKIFEKGPGNIVQDFKEVRNQLPGIIKSRKKELKAGFLIKKLGFNNKYAYYRRLHRTELFAFNEIKTLIEITGYGSEELNDYELLLDHFKGVIGAYNVPEREIYGHLKMFHPTFKRKKENPREFSVEQMAHIFEFLNQQKKEAGN